MGSGKGWVMMAEGDLGENSSLSHVKVNVMCPLGRAKGAQTGSETRLLDGPMSAFLAFELAG